MKIIDETTFVPSSVFYINDTRTTPSTLVPAPLGNQYITASYQNLPNQNISANNFFSFADVELSDLRTFSGDVHKVKVYAKSEGSLGDFEKIYDSPIESSEILLDSSDLTLLGNMGYIQDLSRLNSYWEIYQGSDGNGGSGTLSYSSAYIVDSMKISGSNTQYDDVLRVQLKKDVSFVAGNTYTFRASLYGIKDSVQTINGTTINDGKFEMCGWILKKASSTYMGMANWQRRYLYLQNDKVFLFEGDSEKEMDKAKKMILMKSV